ncbi:hypothetical protein BD289DRAFT_427750 [Coniella lustricola]|uniref:Uncharacterized protein n=1 Tax=Coniella lustricola TaxID=2025994 RepID=A0A2T3AF16_9PEZI|nr:hypothetical protein BD289DRAFT_427750 [Coniella lustricola]
MMGVLGSKWTAARFNEETKSGATRNTPSRNVTRAVYKRGRELSSSRRGRTQRRCVWADGGARFLKSSSVERVVFDDLYGRVVAQNCDLRKSRNGRLSGRQPSLKSESGKTEGSCTSETGLVRSVANKTKGEEGELWEMRGWRSRQGHRCA